MPVRLRTDSADELAARRTSLLAIDAECGWGCDGVSIRLAQKGLRLALLVTQRSHPVVLGVITLHMALQAAACWQARDRNVFVQRQPMHAPAAELAGIALLRQRMKQAREPSWSTGPDGLSHLNCP